MIFFKNTPITDNDILFEAMDDEECLGKCVLRLSDCAEIVCIEDYSDFFVAQGLIKSALNYATLRNIYMTRFLDETAFDIAKALKFTLVNGTYESDIPTILMESCCGGK